MKSLNDIVTEVSKTPYVTSFTSNRVKFGILLTLQIATIPCFIDAFRQYLARRKLRRTISYHVIYLLLLTSFLFVMIAFPLTQAYMFTTYVSPSTPFFCSFWNWFHYSINIINLFLMAYASIERNLLIFKPHIFRSERGRLLLHRCPLVFCLTYPPLFYLGAIFLCPCVNAYDYTQLLCTWPCYFGNPLWANIDLFFNNYMPLLIIPIFCLMICVRVFWKRRLMQLRLMRWRRNKKLLVELLLISGLYLAMWMPLQIIGLVNLFWDPSFLLQAGMDYIFLFPYLIHIIYPIIVLFTIRRKSSAFNRQSNAVQPFHTARLH